jgi:Molydopterin dinucleotide binding domain
MTHERLAVTARRRSSVLTTGGESVEPVQIALGELAGDVSGLQWPSAAEADPNAKFEWKWVEPASGRGATGGGLDLALARSLYDQGTMVKPSAIVQSRVPQPFVELNSHDAEDLSVENGARVRVTLDMKPARVLELGARVNGHVPPGVVLIPNNLDGTYGLPMGARVKIEKVAG